MDSVIYTMALIVHSIAYKKLLQNKDKFCAWIFGFVIVYNLRQLPGKSKIGTARAKYAAVLKLLPKEVEQM